MKDEDIYSAWCTDVAALAVDALGTAKLLAAKDYATAQKIIAEEFRIRLVMGDRPDPSNHRYK